METFARFFTNSKPLFLFHCPVLHQDYSEANTNDCLVNLGPLSLSHWKFICEIHFLFPSHVGHIYVAKRADLPHYQEVFSNFVLALEAYEDTMPVYLYIRGNYSNHFMLVLNSEAAVQPFVERIDWMEIYCASCLPKNKSEKCSVTRKELQDNFGDTGFCSAVSLTTGGNSDGMAEPRLKPETKQNPAVLKGYTVLTNFVTSTPCQVDG